MAWEADPVLIRGAITMPTCGNCAKTVGISDVTCPHCGVILAAYASPTGSGAAGTYEEPEPPPVPEIPTPEMEVKPPSEQDVVTDPDEVAVEAISTAPRPLFDTRLTVEEIARAAEGDHSEDVVTISDKKIATKAVVFDTPDWAKPPRDAEPIPTIDEDDASIPLITHDHASSGSGSDSAPARKSSDDDDDSSEPEPEPEPASESWLYSRPQLSTAPRNEPARTPKPAPEPDQRPVDSAEPVGETDDYIRRLHQEAGYTIDSGPVSQPVEERRLTPAERRKNRTRAFSSDHGNQATAANKSTNTGCATLYILVLVVLWFSTVVAVTSGTFNPGLLFITFAATWGYGPVRKFINETRAT